MRMPSHSLPPLLWRGLYAHDLPPDPLTPHDRPDPAHPPQGPDREPPHIDDPEPLDHPVPIGEPPTPPRPMA